MRYSATHKQEIRERLLDSSRAIAKSGGFEATGIDALMAAVGLTGGAFYSHFRSKDELFAALVDREMAHSLDMLAGGEAGPGGLGRTLRAYLGNHHAEHPETGCALPTLGAEIARGPSTVRSSVERSLRKLQRRWRRRLNGDGDQAWALLAQCVGGVVMARAVASARARREILSAGRRAIEQTLRASAPVETEGSGD